jgi:hypothetical protein
MPEKVNKIQDALMRVSGAVMLIFNLLVGLVIFALVVKDIEDAQRQCPETGCEVTIGAEAAIIILFMAAAVVGVYLSIYLLRVKQKAVMAAIILSAIWLIFFIAAFFTSWLQIDCKTLLAEIALMSPSLITLILLFLARFRFQ